MTVLYLGTDPSRFITGKTVVHFPLIDIVPTDPGSRCMQASWSDFPLYTHILFTSRNTVPLFLKILHGFSLEESALKKKEILAIGQGTAASLSDMGLSVAGIAREETQEGVIQLLKLLDTDALYLFYPRSLKSRSHLETFLIEGQIRHQICNLYEPLPRKIEKIPLLDQFEEIVFTSPSTVRAFMEIYGSIPENKKITALGPVTLEAIHRAKNG